MPSNMNSDWLGDHRDSIKSVVIERGVTSIADFTFKDHGKLPSVTIPASITSIENYAFDNCDCLTDVYYDGSEIDWRKIKGGGKPTGESIHIHYKHNEDASKTVWDGTIADSCAGGNGTESDPYLISMVPFIP